MDFVQWAVDEIEDAFEAGPVLDGCVLLWSKESCGGVHPGDKHYCQPHARLVAKETANGSAT